MADPIAVIIRFSGDPDDLLERFERARQLWVDAQDDDYERPAFYAACKTNDGLAIVNGWRTAVAHRALVKGCTLISRRWAWASRIRSSGCGSRSSAGLKDVHLASTSPHTNDLARNGSPTRIG
jgi:hypothetical protein